MSVTENWPSSVPGPADDNYEWEESPRVNIAQFGDGYEARSADGLNTRPRKLTLDWPNLEVGDKNTILNFLRDRNGVEAFNWTPPGETSSIKVKAPTWSVRRRSGPYWSITITFQEVFDQ
jgi:phage-related protein